MNTRHKGYVVGVDTMANAPDRSGVRVRVKVKDPGDSLNNKNFVVAVLPAEVPLEVLRTRPDVTFDLVNYGNQLKAINLQLAAA